MEPEEQSFETYYTWSQRLIRWRPVLKRAGLALFFLFDITLILFFLWSFVDYGVFDYFDDRAMIGSIIDPTNHQQDISTKRAAVALSVDETKIFTIDATRVDLYANLSNTNEDWYATFRYQFSYGGKLTEERQGFILPGQTSKPIVELGFKADAVSRQAKLVLRSVDWIRVNHHLIDNYQTWQKRRLNFVFSDLVYQQQSDVGSGIGARTMFTVKNASAYSYWNPTFVVVLRRNQEPVGITTVSVSSFGAGESRPVSVNWFGTAPPANETVIEPLIDIFDPSVYMPLRGESQPDVRERIIE